MPAAPLPITRFAALSYRNYRLFWIGGILTNNGRWIHYVASSWIIFSLTGSPAWIGASAFATFIPMVVMNPVAGWVSDHRDRRRTLLTTNLARAALAATLAVAWAAGLREPWAWVALFAADGVVNGVQLPVWQAFVSECVPRPVLPNAITLNSTQFNAARAVGPAVGGMIIGTFGAGWALAAVAVFYVPVVTCLGLIDPARLESSKREGDAAASIVAGYREGVRYVLDAPGIRTAIMTVTLISVFAMPLVQQIVTFAERVFEVSPFWFGVLGSAQGVGAVLAAPVLAGTAGRRHRGRVQFLALMGYGVAVAVFGSAPAFWVGFVALLVIGAMHLLSASNLISVVQMQVDDAVRGRVMAIYLMGVLGMVPFSNLVMGALISTFGPRPVVTGGGCALFAGGLFLYLSGRLDRLDD